MKIGCPMNSKILNVVITIISGLIISIFTYFGHTIYTLDKHYGLIEYKLDQVNRVLQDLYDQRKYTTGLSHETK